MKWIRAAIVGIGTVLALPAVALAQGAPPEGNPGASLNGLPFSGSIRDLTMWITGIGFAVCLGVFLSGAGVLRPLGHLFGHKDTAVRGTTSMVVSGTGAFLLAAGFIIVTFLWNTGGGMH